MTDVAERIVAFCDANPPMDVDGHPELFSDYGDDRVSQSLFKLWQKGLIDAAWDEDEAVTRTSLTEFGAELVERDLVDAYVGALEYEVDVGIDASPAAMEVPKP